MSTYPIPEDTEKRIDNNFQYHAPKEGQQEKYEQIRDTAKDFAHKLVNLCPPSRELSLALTDLESLVMWANAAIARNE
jgi:hypothetical protein